MPASRPRRFSDVLLLVICAALLAAAALLALLRFRVGIIPVILGCGAAGLAYQLAM